MAHLLRFDDLKSRTGTTVYEEWIYGTGAFPVTVMSVVSDNVILLERQTDNTRYCTRKTGREYRYWDDVPTDDQRELTDWGWAL